MVFLSRLTIKKGLDVLLAALPALKGEVELDLYGVKDEPDFWESCAQTIEKLPANIAVAYRGTVAPEAVPATLQAYHVFAMPTRGENFGHAIFEAFTAGRPVLISQNTPWRDLPAQKAGWDMPREASAFAQSLQRLIDMNQDEYDPWAEGARQLAADYLARPGRVAAYAELFEPAEEPGKNP